jgi:hypothetical protein
MTNPDNENLEALESDDYKAFMDIVKGLTAHQAALALNSLTPGIDWRNCSKGFMAPSGAAEPKSGSSVLPRCLRLNVWLGQ